VQSRNWLNLTIINQVLQIVGVYIGGYGLEYVSGVGLGFTLDLTNQLLIGVNFNLSTLNYKLNLSPEKYFFSFNLTAMFIIYYVEKIRAGQKTGKVVIDEHNA
jgi:hypothetical protein